jgi:hypothetical protein
MELIANQYIAKLLLNVAMTTLILTNISLSPVIKIIIKKKNQYDCQAPGKF